MKILILIASLVLMTSTLWTSLARAQGTVQEGAQGSVQEIAQESVPTSACNAKALLDIQQNKITSPAKREASSERAAWDLAWRQAKAGCENLGGLNCEMVHGPKPTSRVEQHSEWRVSMAPYRPPYWYLDEWEETIWTAEVIFKGVRRLHPESARQAICQLTEACLVAPGNLSSKELDRWNELARAKRCDYQL